MESKLAFPFALGFLWFAGGCGSSSDFAVKTGRASVPKDGRYIYAALNNGSIHIYAIDNGHQEVAAFDTVPGVADVRRVRERGNGDVLHRAPDLTRRLRGGGRSPYKQRDLEPRLSTQR